MSETEKIVQEYIDGLINSLSNGYHSVRIPTLLKALREIQDVVRKEIKGK